MTEEDRRDPDVNVMGMLGVTFRVQTPPRSAIGRALRVSLELPGKEARHGLESVCNEIEIVSWVTAQVVAADSPPMTAGHKAVTTR